MTRARGIVLLGIAGLLLVLAFVRIDLEPLRPRLETALSEALDRGVDLSGVALRLLPLPHLEVRGMVVEGASPGAPPLARVPRADLWVHPLPLLWRRQLEVTLELAEPEVHLEAGDGALPPLPLPGRVPLPTQTEAETEPDEGGLQVPEIVLRGVRISDGAVSWGGITANRIEASGSLEAGGAGSLDLEADVAPLGRLREVRVRLDLSEGVPRVEVQGRILEGDLAAVDRALGLGKGLGGMVTAEFQGRVEGTSLREVQLTVEIEQGEVQALDLVLEGRLEARVQAGGPFRVDLTQMALEVPGRLGKPSGEPFVAWGSLPEELPPPELTDLRVQLGATTVPLQVRLEPLRIRIQPTEIPLAPILALLELETPLKGTQGSVRLEAPLSITPDPLDVRGSVRLESVEVPLERGPLRLSGQLDGRGREIVMRGFRADLAGHPFTLSGRVRLPGLAFDGEASTEEANLEELGRLLTGHTELSGLLTARVRVSGGVLSGGDLLASLRGDARVDIREGRLKGFSLAREALGELAAVPLLVARLKGKDLSRYEEQEFEELSGDFRLQQGVVRTDNLTLRYRYSTARLRGTVRLEDGGLDLSGTLTLAREVDEELGGTARERVIPIAGIGGTVTEPRVKLDRDALIALTQSYLGQSRLREKLEERVGSEGAEVIEGVLEQIFKRKR